MNIQDNLKKLSETIIKLGAPALGTLLCGGAGNIIGQIIADKFGGNVDHTDDLIKKINMTPDALIKLEEIKKNHDIEIKKLLFEQAKTEIIQKNKEISLDNKNIENARSYNFSSGTIMPHLISVFIVFAFFICIWLILNHNQDIENKDIVYMLVGTLSASFGSVITYWMGSSSGSRNKEAAIFDQMKTLITGQKESPNK